MYQKKLNRPVLTLLSLLLVAVPTAMYGCAQGDTDGGEAVSNDGGNGNQFEPDGSGAGGRLAIEVQDDLVVGGRSEFFVSATDPSGNPIQFLRIFCETEKGIAIIEPSSQGFAYESTNDRGVMSGTLGGLLAGSWMIECTGPDGSGLRIRDTLRITGSVPDGFNGFPGAAGGNLGGGTIPDDGPASDSVTVSSISISEVGSSDTNQVDIVPGTDCDGDSVNDDPEPFQVNNYSVVVNNGSSSTVNIETIKFTMSDGSSSSTQGQTVAIPAGSSGTLSGPFTEGTGSGKKLAGGSTLTTGTVTVTATVTGQTALGEDFTIRGKIPLTFGNFNNCSD